jgi:hypothetical protein
VIRRRARYIFSLFDFHVYVLADFVPM